KDLARPVLYFGLPGNPLSTVVGALQFVIPALWQMSGASIQERPCPLTFTATLKNDLKKSVGRMDFQRGVLTQNEAGSLQVESFAKQQSHRIKQLSHANCFIVLAQDMGNLPAGEKVLVQPFPWFFN
ncbi:molybdopterin molybdenumtransferase MoeA, partial [Psychrobacter namhaensis]